MDWLPEPSLLILSITAAMTERAYPQLDNLSRDFLRLTLSIDRHLPGYVDAYYGPADIKASVDATDPVPVGQLRDMAANVAADLPRDDATRAAYLRATLRSIDCTLDLIDGKPVDYLEEVQRIYDIQPALVHEAVFETAQRTLDRALPAGQPGETLGDRLHRFRRLFEFETGRIADLVDLVSQETRARTQAFVSLPPTESVEVTLVEGQPWAANNKYLGHYHSEIEINADLPMSAAQLLGTFAHEGYPGHHSEAALKELFLFNERGYGEQSVLLLHSPAAVIAEAIATSALEMIFPDNSHHAWNTDVIFPAAGLGDEAREAAACLQQVDEAAQQLRHVTANAAILFHNGRLNANETVDYIQTYGLATPERAARSFRFLSHPVYRSYVFTYTQGYDLLNRQPEKTVAFRHLLTEPVLPSDLVKSMHHE